LAAGLLLGGQATPVEGQAQPNRGPRRADSARWGGSAGFAAVPGERGGLDITGPYEVVAKIEDC